MQLLTTSLTSAGRVPGDAAGASETPADAAGMSGPPTTLAMLGCSSGASAAAPAMVGMGAGTLSWAARLTRNSAVRLHPCATHACQSPLMENLWDIPPCAAIVRCLKTRIFKEHVPT